MRLEEVTRVVRPLAEELLCAQRMEVVDLALRYEGSRMVITVLIDRPEGGITLDECAAVNRALGDKLETAGCIQQGYILEVASPGIDRPLKTRRDFERSLNKQAKFFLNEGINGKIEWDGQIQRVTDTLVAITTKTGLLEIPLTSINKAKLLID
ncbi:MAG TPA: ribosome maturation factor RimP [Candidatus Omnitrophota bacterium]|nr:ribosome maturation factor RimP [Candidatus Omnitrophota bacterium]HRZ15449.1 ribosome maturation factor RimP [Candidatus Omnitrophota bacterium]